LRRASNTNVGEITNTQIIRDGRERNVLDASFVAFLPHLSSNVIRRVAAGEANADVPIGEHIGQVMQHEKVAEKRVAETDEI
jgi:hypothetical protein